ncbi:MAG: hypothetical protein ACLSWY_08735 [Ruthenibacterium lactatiformans]
MRAVPHGMRRTCVSRPKAGDKERPACGSRGLTDIRRARRAPCAAHVRRAPLQAPQAAVTLGLACLTLAIVLLAVLRQTSAAQPAGTERRRRAERRSAHGRGAP